MNDLRIWGYTYGDIQKMKRERDSYRFALNTIVSGSFGKEPPRDVRSARRVALMALVGKRKRDRKRVA